HESDLGDHGVNDAVRRHDPVDRDTGQRDSILRMPAPEAAGMRENHATAIATDGAQNPSMHARATAAGDHVAAEEGVVCSLLHLTLLPGVPGLCGADLRVKAWGPAFPAGPAGAGHKASPRSPAARRS